MNMPFHLKHSHRLGLLMSKRSVSLTIILHLQLRLLVSPASQQLARVESCMRYGRGSSRPIRRPLRAASRCLVDCFPVNAAPPAARHRSGGNVTEPMRADVTSRRNLSATAQPQAAIERFLLSPPSRAFGRGRGQQRSRSLFRRLQSYSRAPSLGGVTKTSRVRLTPPFGTVNPNRSP